jgi:pteridine reductase
MKTALISGGAARIGAQIVRTLHENGYKVIIHCHQSEEVAQTLCRELNSKRNNSAQVVVADLGDNKDIKKLTQTIKSLDLLVNNASVFYPTSIKNSTIEDWDKTININLRAPFFIATGLSKVLAISQGSIINIIDIHSDRPLKKFSIYNISKAGLKMLTKTLAKELAPNIRVNGISPGSILWPQDESQLSDKEKMMMLDRIALNRQGSTEDIAEAVLFLADSKYITGQVINIDGGRSLNQ